MSDDPTRQPRDWPNLRVNGERMVPLCCQECGVQMGLRSPGPPPDPSYCFDCAPILSPALTAQLFDCLADAWVRDTQFTSSLEEIMSHPAVGLLVSLGRPIPGSYYSPGYYPTDARARREERERLMSDEAIRSAAIALLHSDIPQVWDESWFELTKAQRRGFRLAARAALSAALAEQGEPDDA